MQELTNIPVDRAKLEQIEQALMILAAVVARLAKEARAAKLRDDPSRNLRYVLQQMEARLDAIERDANRPAQATHELLESIQTSLTRVMKIREARAS